VIELDHVAPLLVVQRARIGDERKCIEGHVVVHDGSSLPESDPGIVIVRCSSRGHDLPAILPAWARTSMPFLVPATGLRFHRPLAVDPSGTNPAPRLGRRKDEPHTSGSDTAAARGGAPDMAVQPGLGLLPERGTRSPASDPHHHGAHANRSMKAIRGAE